MYSDNFTGGNRVLTLFLSEHHQQQIITKLAEQGTEWHFIPLCASHFHGLWEAGVRSMKHHLRRVGQNVKLDSIVLVKEDNVPPLCWKIVRVKLYPRTDKLVLVVTLQTARGEFKRTIFQLYPRQEEMFVLRNRGEKCPCLKMRNVMARYCLCSSSSGLSVQGRVQDRAGMQGSSKSRLYYKQTCVLL
ncbi:hypothetical protein PR048_001702 [Dryococelus australis]|uniref:DUF5641 domain-containing protein n=1 Tax=Dryococelus australis TaxID=614101 RepID=A0ABQ9II39_9NEOP|nr:hypothetical protein PR048_001702 [Dryococelus australis]